MQRIYPRILIVCKENESTIEQFDRWMDNIATIGAEQFEIELFVVDVCENNKFSKRLTRENIPFYWSKPYGKTIQKRLAESYETARQYALEERYDFMFFVSGDLFPEPAILSFLASTKLLIIGIPYYNSLAEHNLKFIENNDGYHTRHIWTPGIEELAHWLNGNIRYVYSVGFGCVLMKRYLFSRTPFKYDPKNKMTVEDIFFADLWSNRVQVWCDTSMLLSSNNNI